jgi:hypothetical protein
VVIEGKMRDFGQAGHNSDYEPMTLKDAIDKWYS